MQIIVLFLLLSTMLMRPALLGESYTLLGVALSGMTFILYLFINMKLIKIEGKLLKIFLINSLYWFYLLIQSMFIQDSNYIGILKDTIITLPVIFFFAVIFSNKKYRFNFGKNFILILYYLSISYLITLGLTFFIDIESLFLFQINIGKYFTGGNIYFPLTPIYGFMNVENFSIIKFQSLFRESGISQAFIIWAIFNLKKFKLDKKIVYVALHLGLIGTTSTAGLVTYFITLLVYIMLSKKISVGRIINILIIFLVGVLLVFKMPFFGFSNKIQTHSDSINERTQITAGALNDIILNPFGEGIKTTDLPNSGINMLSLSEKIGLVGFIILLLTFTYPYFISQNKRGYTVSLLPILITALFSQPIAGYSIIAIISMLGISDDES
ncbi:hypothetical protein TU65_07695 [Bacillus wiedmannii]|uniref:hypothetical protein n=1 Tax=Bacillus wiedmannii TaxID=1890302 RepID=UPI00065B9D1F|nr:hypothetical protein [Bacillus wiedmannii]KMP97143.1 hypothetical protein TU65_07695 [Bacillus wiedmannii]PHB95629.1 hypothetical protein COE98_01465 [Bacillus wiedmannii]SCN11620.1 Uncharacterized protein BCRIVMBC126_05490 [Bacillus wiedmannii]